MHIMIFKSLIGNKIKNDDIMETVNHFQCFNYMLEHVEEPLSEEMIKKFHNILKSNTPDSRKTWLNVGE